LKYLDLNDNISHTASSFGTGIGRADLCGLLTGGHMAVGAAAGIIHKKPKIRQIYAGNLSSQFRNWWMERAQIHCSKLRPHHDRAGYSRMIQRIALKIEELVGPVRSQSPSAK